MKIIWTKPTFLGLVFGGVSKGNAGGTVFEPESWLDSCGNHVDSNCSWLPWTFVENSESLFSNVSRGPMARGQGLDPHPQLLSSAWFPTWKAKDSWETSHEAPPKSRIVDSKMCLGSRWKQNWDPTLPETNSEFASENRPKPNRKQSYSNHPFLRTILV